MASHDLCNAKTTILGASNSWSDSRNYLGTHMEIFHLPILVDASDIFYFFSSLTMKRDSEAPGVDFALKIPGGGGGGGSRGREGPRGREGLERIEEFFGGGGSEYFLSGPKCPPSNAFSERFQELAWSPRVRTKNVTSLSGLPKTSVLPMSRSKFFPLPYV